MSGRISYLVLAAAAVLGCEQTPATATFAQSDSAGVVIAQNAIDVSAVEVWSVSAAPRTRIGVVAGEEEYQLFRVSDVTRLPTGEIVVLNSGSHTIRVYDRDGRFEREFGGEGQGPGEFRYPTGISLIESERLIVWDNRPFRVSTFGVDGVFIRSDRVSREAVGELISPPFFTEFSQLLSDGDILVHLFESGGAETSPDGPFRPRGGFIQVSTDLSSIDTLGFFGGIEQMYVEVGGRPSATVLPFAKRTVLGFEGDPARVCVGDQLEPRVECFQSGSHLSIRWTQRPVEITSAEFEWWDQRIRTRYRERGSEQEGNRLIEAVARPEHKPPYTTVVVDKLNHVWVGGESRPTDTSRPPPFRVFDDVGRLVASAVLPQATVMEIGQDYILVVRRDENGVEFVELYDLVRGG